MYSNSPFQTFFSVILFSCEDFLPGASLSYIAKVQKEKEPCKNKIRGEILHSISVKGNNYYGKNFYYTEGDVGVF